MDAKEFELSPLGPLSPRSEEKVSIEHSQGTQGTQGPGENAIDISLVAAVEDELKDTARDHDQGTKESLSELPQQDHSLDQFDEL